MSRTPTKVPDPNKIDLQPNRRGFYGVIAGILVGISGTLLTMVAGEEGLRYHAYQDTKGVWTICYGYTRGVKRGDTKTKAECEALLVEELEIAQRGVRRAIKVPINRNQLDAYTDFAYNVGVANFTNSTMLRKLNQGDYAGSCKEFHRWVYVGKLDCRLSSSRCGGIPKRRDKEFELCVTPNTEVIQPWHLQK